MWLFLAMHREQKSIEQLEGDLGPPPLRVGLGASPSMPHQHVVCCWRCVPGAEEHRGARGGLGARAQGQAPGGAPGERGTLQDAHC